MSAGAGHIFEMIARLKQNKELRNRRNHYLKYKGWYQERIIEEGKLGFKELTEAEKKRVRLKVQEEAKQEHVRMGMIAVAGIVVGLVLVGIGWWLLSVLFS